MRLILAMLFATSVALSADKVDERVVYFGKALNKALSLQKEKVETQYETQYVDDTCYRQVQQGTEEECHNEYETQCHQEYECHTEYEETCHTEYEQECHTEYERSCDDEYIEHCITVNDNVCETEYTQECHTETRCPTRPGTLCREEQICRQVPNQSCHNEPRQRCETIRNPRCHDVPRERCESVPRQRCESTPRQECGYENECEQVPREVCEQVPHYVSEAYSCQTPVQVPVGSAVTFTTKGKISFLVNELPPGIQAQERFLVSLSENGVSLRLEDQSKNILLVSDKQESVSTAPKEKTYTTKLNINALSVEALSAPIKDGISEISIESSVLKFKLGKGAAAQFLKTTLKLVRKKTIGSKTVFEGAIGSDKLKVVDVGEKSEVSIDLNKLNLEEEIKKAKYKVGLILSLTAGPESMNPEILPADVTTSQQVEIESK